jgi:hypothetical protein
MADDDFDHLSADEKLARLRSALKAFADIQRQQGDKIISLSARTNLLKGALTVVLTKLAKASVDPERFVMDAEKVLADVRAHLTPSSDALVAAEYDAGIKELFDLLRSVADPTGQRRKKPNQDFYAQSERRLSNSFVLLRVQWCWHVGAASPNVRSRRKLPVQDRTGEGPQSTRCCRFPYNQGWTAVDPSHRSDAPANPLNCPTAVSGSKIL